jgi:integrase/recombinase XerD
MFKHNLTAVLNKQRKDKNGNFALRLRTIIKGKPQYYSTGIVLKVSEWDQVKQKVILHPNKALLNATISKKYFELEKDLLELHLTGSILTVAVKTKNKSFYDFIEKEISDNKSIRAKATTTHHLSYLAKLKSFKPILLFSQINAQLLKDFENFCRQKGNIPNTIWSASKFFKTYINKAKRIGLLENNVIDNFEGTRYTDPMRMYLTAEEIKALEKLAIDPATYAPYTRAANWFLFSCYCGLRYGDAAALEPSNNIEGKGLVLQVQKTKEILAIPLHDRLINVISRIDSKLTSNQDYNRNLKAVAALCEINKPLTSHIARHTFAVQFLERGGSMEVLSKLMGHSTMKTTQIYGKITDLRIENEVKKVWG